MTRMRSDCFQIGACIVRQPSLNVRSWRRLVGKSKTNTAPTPELDEACADGVAETRKHLTTDLLRRCQGA